MGLVGFPDYIQVTLGTNWSANMPTNQPLVPYETLTLTKVSGIDAWTEDGSATPTASNRLKFEPRTSGGITAHLAAGSTSWRVLGQHYSWSTTVYTFGDLWGGAGFGNWSFGYFSGFFTGFSATYNPGIFSSFAAPPSESDILVLDGETIIPDGLTTPVVFGPGMAGETIQKTFTVENNGILDLNITSVTVPSGFSIVQNLPGTIASMSSAELIVQRDSSTVGTAGGDIEIVSDDPDTATYNFAVTGEVTTLTMHLPPIVVEMLVNERDLLQLGEVRMDLPPLPVLVMSHPPVFELIDDGGIDVTATASPAGNVGHGTGDASVLVTADAAAAGTPGHGDGSAAVLVSADAAAGGSGGYGTAEVSTNIVDVTASVLPAGNVGHGTGEATVLVTADAAAAGSPGHGDGSVAVLVSAEAAAGGTGGYGIAEVTTNIIDRSAVVAAAGNAGYGTGDASVLVTAEATTGGSGGYGTASVTVIQFNAAWARAATQLLGGGMIQS